MTGRAENKKQATRRAGQPVLSSNRAGTTGATNNMEKLDKEFKDLLENRTLTDLRKHSGAVYGVWGDMRLGYLSPGWFRFAKENGGEPSISVDWGLGKSILDSTTNNVRDFYEAKLNACMNSGEVWKHEYECSIHQIYRRFHQVAYPLGQREGLLLVNSIVVEQPHDLVERPVQAADVGIYTDENE